MGDHLTRISDEIQYDILTPDNLLDIFIRGILFWYLMSHLGSKPTLLDLPSMDKCSK